MNASLLILDQTLTEKPFRRTATFDTAFEDCDWT